ncbi:hypothetical protein [Leyella stercorea]|uniref:hypothetical protein n=1 Tax=Leyella stercorea TaxID=363265 RepID=UPI00242DF0A6|nr:hypothetical protein [Leyella stercorea]
MKKILSLLSMLMITVMAFATDYKGQLDYILTTRNGDLTGPSYAQGTLKIEPYAGGKYTVTATGCDLSSIDKDLGNWDEIICEGVEGTTDANGVTTIDVAPYAFRGSDNAELKNAKLFVKFKGDKAYATFEGTYNPNFYTNYKLKYTFGVDEGFDGGSTGGGETGGETSSIVTVLENYTNDGNRFSHSFKIDWDKQKVVMSIDPTPCGNDLEHIVGLGVDCTQWNNALHVYNKYFNVYEGKSYNKQMLQAYFQTASSNNNTGVIDRKSPFSVEVSKEKGFAIDGEVKISASKMADLFTHADLTVGSGQGGDAASHAKYNYIKVVPLNWTEVPPVTVEKTFTYDKDAYVGTNGTNGTANVKVNKMTDGSYTMEITAPVATKVGAITVSEDAKGRTIYMGEVESATVSGVKYLVHGVVYTAEDGTEHLYMTLSNSNEDVTYTIGENPDAPKVVATLPFENVAYTTSYNESGNTTVTFTEMSDGTFPMTFVSEAIKAAADNLTKATDAKGRTTYTGTAKRTDVTFDVTFTVKAVVYTEGAEKKLYMTMVSVDGTTFTVGEDPDYVAPEPEIEGTVVEGSKNYAANGSKFEWSNIAINWNKQKLVAVIDLSSCTGTSENILSVGQNIGSWSIGGWHFYYTVASKKMKSDYLATDGAHPVSDPKTGVEPGTVRIELSKAEGCTIDGVSYNALYDSSVTGTWQSNTEDFWNLTSVNIGSKEGANRSNAVIKYVTVVDLPVTVKDEKTFNEALYMVQGTTSTKVADAKVVVKEMSDNTVNMSLQFNGNEYTSTELVKGTDEKNRTTYTGKVSKDTQTFDVAGVVYEKETADRLYMTMTATGVTFVVGENPDVVTPDVTEESNKTYTSNLRIFDGEEPVVENAEAQVNIIKYSDDSYKVTLKNVNMLNKTQDLVFVGKVITDVTDSEAPLTIMAKSDEATTNVFGEQVSGTFEITEVSADEIKMGFSMESQNFSYQGEFNYTEEEEPEVYTNNLHIYDAAAPATDLFQADQAKVEFLATETGEFKLTLKDVTLNEKTQDLVFTGALPTPQPGGQDPLAEEGETTPAEPAMVLNATADEATATFLGTTSATAVFNVIMNDEAETENDAFALTFTITAGEKTLGGEFNYEKKDPDTPDPELFCKENYVADGTGFEWDINVDWDTQKIVMSIDPSTCTGSCEDVIGLGAVPTAWDNTLHLYRTSADQMLQGYFNVPGGSNNNTDKFAETAPFLVEVSKAQGFVVNNEVKIAASEMSYLFTLPTVKMGTGEGANDKSRATYNYVKVVDKNWTAPKDPDTGINATTVAEGEVEFFTVNGVKLNKLQKGLNIVRSADGKVKKVLVK